MSKKLRLPYRFISQLAVKLKVAGIVSSFEGRTGGYVLEEGWGSKNLYDLLSALGENRRMVKCLGDEECARVAECELRGIWGKIENSLINELKKIKLAEI